MNDEELDRLVADLPREADISPKVQGTMWAEIQPHIEAERAASRWGVWLAAAALLLSVGGVFGLMPQASTIVPTLAGLPRSPKTGTGLLPAEDDLQAAVTDLERAYQQRRERLDPALLAIYDENLALVGDAVANSRAALAAHPGDPHLQRMLRHAYDQKLSLLARAAAPSGGSRAW